MGIQYKFHDDYPESILVRNFVDLVNVDDIIDSWEYLIASKLINDNIKGIINNLTGCSLDMNLESFRKLIEYLRAKDQLKKLKLAVICNDPKTIVFPTLGQQGELDLRIRPFSTERAAVNWIMSQ